MNRIYLMLSIVIKRISECQSVIQPHTKIHYWPDDPINAKATNKMKRHIKE